MTGLLARLRGREGDAGVTIVELLVVMVIMGGLMSACYVVLDKVFLQSRDTQARADALQQVRQGVAVMDRQVRSASGITGSASPSTTFRVLTVDGGTSTCTQWRQDGERLQRRTWTSTNSTPTEWATIASQLKPVTSGGPFTVVAAGTGGRDSALITLTAKGKSAQDQPVIAALTARNRVTGNTVCSQN